MVDIHSEYNDVTYSEGCAGAVKRILSKMDGKIYSFSRIHSSVWDPSVLFEQMAHSHPYSHNRCQNCGDKRRRKVRDCVSRRCNS
jgi:hypothetical protein